MSPIELLVDACGDDDQQKRYVSEFPLHKRWKAASCPRQKRKTKNLEKQIEFSSNCIREKYARRRLPQQSEVGGQHHKSWAEQIIVASN